MWIVRDGNRAWETWDLDFTTKEYHWVRGLAGTRVEPTKSLCGRETISSSFYGNHAKRLYRDTLYCQDCMAVKTMEQLAE